MSKREPVLSPFATIPVEKAVLAARDAGRAALLDQLLVRPVASDMWENWMKTNVPCSAGESDEDFGARVDSMMDAFLEGIDECLRDAPTAPRTTFGPDRSVRQEPLRCLNELTAMIWGVVGLAQQAAETNPKYVDAYVLRMSELAFQIEQALDMTSTRDTAEVTA